MPQDLISKKTRYEYQEYFVGTTLREIEAAFDAADIPCDMNFMPPTSGARRSLVQQYYHSVDWTKWADIRKVLVVYQTILAELELATQNTDGFSLEHMQRIFPALRKWIERDGFIYKDGRLAPIGRAAHLVDMQAAIAQLDAPELHRQIERMRDAVSDDPALAIGTAKELVETTCKTILTARGVVFDDKSDIAELVKEARKVLGLLPDGVHSASKGVETIRKLLSNLGTIAQGLGELRNLYGTGHGKHGGAKGLTQRHARLAVGAASTLATFLFETHEERPK